MKKIFTLFILLSCWSSLRSQCSPTLAVTSTSIICKNTATGSATVTATGDSPFTYSWLPTGGTSSVAANLAAGIYSCVVTNSCGTVTETVQITEPALTFTASVAVTNPRCELGFGSATVTTTGGSGSYQYDWSNGQQGNFISFIHAGVFTATVTDLTCSSTAIATGTLTDPPSIFYTFGSNGIPCHGGTGTAFVSATGGGGAFTYSWTNGATTGTITNLGPGGYSVTVTDSYSCSNVMGVTLIDPPVFTATVSVTQPLCNGGTGTIAVTAAGGTTPYNYSLTSLSFSSIFNNVAAGTYTLITKDANDCTVTNTVSVVMPAPVTVTTSASTSSVCLGSSATLSASASGGTGVMSYTWTSGPLTSTYAVSPSANTTYTVNVADVNGCAASKTIALTVSALPTISIANGSVCTGKSFTLSPSGAANYTYSSGSAIVSPVATQVYTIGGTNSAGCAAQSVTTNITVNGLPTLTVNNATICAGVQTVIVPTGAATYTITGGTFSVAPTSSTSYSITGTDNNGCVSNAVVSSVSVMPLPTVSVNNGTICSGENFTIVPSGITGGTYTITGSTFTVNPVTTTNYSVNGTDSRGCVSAAAVSTVSVKTTPTLAVNNATICSGNSAVLTPSGAGSYTITGGSFTVSPVITSHYTLTGTGANGCEANSVVATVLVKTTPTVSFNSATTTCVGQTVIITPAGATNYTLTGGTSPLTGSSFSVSPLINTTYTLIGANNGCPSGSVDQEISVYTYPTPTLSMTDHSICAGESVTLTAFGGMTYSWTGSNTHSSSIVVTPNQTTTYTATVYNGSCASSKTLAITVNTCTGIKERVFVLSGVKLYPNPNNGQFIVESAEPATLVILSITGEEVLRQTNVKETTRINISELANGIYFVRMISGNEQTNIKVIKH